MRNAERVHAEEIVKSLQAITKNLKSKNAALVQELFIECQQAAINLGNAIEASEGEGFITVKLIEQYCENLFLVCENLNNHKSVEALFQELQNNLKQIEKSIRQDIPAKKEVVFLPYKASMWDSLESVWQAADADEDYNAYVVPIPYYDKKPDGSFGTFHYEGKDFPEYVPITHYNDYDIEECQPDIIYIHNPYDEGNYVTSVEPGYYSERLKKNCRCLVYIPYYVTAGSMNEAQESFMVYKNVDYIIVQAEKYLKFFRNASLLKKVQPFGSPKYDRVIRMCKNPGEPPEEWKPLLKDKKVYFYNTSISHMLTDTVRFLQKMEYVFKCFAGRKDACLIWRPHPLLEATFASMRPRFIPAFENLKKYFIENGLGIYDDTPDVTQTISLCDAYVGEIGSSITSMFGIAGKPLFILSRYINSEPQSEDWRGEAIEPYLPVDTGDWKISRRNRLYHLDHKTGCYRYFCKLSNYASGAYYAYYLKTIEIGEKVYVCPRNAQDILIISGGRIEKRISLKRLTERQCVFAEAYQIEKYILLIPEGYPSIVRYDTSNEKIDYMYDIQTAFRGSIEEGKRVGGNCVWENCLMLASPTDNLVLAIDGQTGKSQVLTTGVKGYSGCNAMVSDGTDIWMLPFTGNRVIRWNPKTGSTREYSNLPKGFICHNQPYRQKCMERPFSSAAFTEKYVYLAPYWGSMFVRLDRETGEMEEWIPPCAVPEEEPNGYYTSLFARAYFVVRKNEEGKDVYRLCSQYDRKIYEIDLETEVYQEIPIVFDEEDLRRQEPGFCEESDWLQYACVENAWNTLNRMLDGAVIGEAFDKERQLKAYGTIAANHDGTCGEKIHYFVKKGNR